jgi:DeoR/GlpR family transcriptional regulator of sugar metabolism
MLPSVRQKKILELLASKDVITIAEFMAEFDISIETVRRDLNVLEKLGIIQKIYGGAKLRELTFSEPPMENRLVDRRLQKEIIGKKCSEFIHDGDCIFIDSGSTTYHIAKNLTNKNNLTIITNSIPVLNELMMMDCEIIIIGGKIRHNERSVVTYDYLFNFAALNIQKSFICAGGITVRNGISDFNMQEAVTRKIIIERSQEVFVAADSSKFDKDVAINIAALNKISYIITDSQLNRNTLANFKKTKTNLILAED